MSKLIYHSIRAPYFYESLSETPIREPLKRELIEDYLKEKYEKKHKLEYA